MKIKTILVDIDGTLAKNVGRGFHDYDKVFEDEIHEEIVLLVKALSHRWRIILVSGRPDSCMELTKQWLEKYRIPFWGIYMRKTGDFRPDFIIKKELYDEFIEPNYKVMFVLDDRNQVVKMWREIGLKCLQVADGNF